MKPIPEDIRLVAFDLDGTLVDAYQAVTDSINYMMGQMGLPPQTLKAVTYSVGYGIERLIRCFIEEERAVEALKIFRQHHDGRLREKVKLLPGAGKLLADLKKQGYQLAIASNRPTQFCRIILEQLKIDHYFDWVICGDAVKSPKPSPDILKAILKASGVKASQVVYVGDMTVDVLCGRRARVFTVAVPTGSCLKAEMEELKPDRIVKNLSELRRFIFS